MVNGKTEDKRYRRFITAMSALQDHLGSLNDLATAPDTLAALDLSDVVGAEALFSVGDKAKRLHDAAEAHDIVVHTKRFWRSGPVQ